MDLYCKNEHEIALPEPIARLNELVYNLWWVWQADARELFRMWDYPQWRATGHNPVKMLRSMTPKQIEELSRNVPFRRKLEKVMMSFDADMRNGDKWYRQMHPDLNSRPIAYFSFEFGLHNSIPIYSGGLGILSGDHCKEASDLGVPLVAVGFMYPQGYFRQRIPSHGWQEAVYDPIDFRDTPVLPVTDEKGERVYLEVQLDTRPVYVELWCVHVGRMRIILMDTDTDRNAPWDRELTARLYGGDQETRIQQEVILGIGGVRALRRLGITPAAWHMNEGHSAFMVLERMREMVQAGVPFEQARQIVYGTSAFTTHTPVPAGHDAFPFHLMEKYFWHYWGEMGLDRERFMALGVHTNGQSAFNMTVLAMRNSEHINAVSQLHTEISRDMWQNLWPGQPAPIIPITNGVHVPTWISGEMSHMLERYLGHDWLDRHDERSMWERVHDVPDRKLWEVKQALKRKMFTSIWDRARRRWIEGGADPAQMVMSGMLLDPEALTIGFARRFATYKRATLIFRDLERLKRILVDTRRPVQLVFAGKAHPADEPGKHLIQQIVRLAQDPAMGGRIAFIQDYDMNLARFLIQGVDVWLNTPRRPREASGTSGQKAGLNGTPNLSILDGWWPEAYDGANGWAIGAGREFESDDQQDAADAESLYRLLEEEVVPLYYQRDADGVPRGWVAVMKESMMTVGPKFSMRRMLKEYVERIYAPAMRAAMAVEEKEAA
jgi:starch phosphorylase